jgi:endonuclease YncB( thermonuclease family)
MKYFLIIAAIFVAFCVLVLVGPGLLLQKLQKDNLLKDNFLIGKVVGITDGDTITLLVGKTQHKIRLAWIDAPEKKQPFGTKAKEALSDKVFGKEVKVESKGQDRYKRTLGIVFVNDHNINQKMIEEGWVWQYYNEDVNLKEKESVAKKAKLGLWADSKPIPPWEWRKGKHE